VTACLGIRRDKTYAGLRRCGRALAVFLPLWSSSIVMGSMAHTDEICEHLLTTWHCVLELQQNVLRFITPLLCPPHCILNDACGPSLRQTWDQCWSNSRRLRSPDHRLSLPHSSPSQLSLLPPSTLLLSFCRAPCRLRTVSCHRGLGRVHCITSDVRKTGPSTNSME
jgi:hypothetical protein